MRMEKKSISYNNWMYLLTLVLLLSANGVVRAGKSDKESDHNKQKSAYDTIISGMKFRSIGPAYASGRIADFAVNPNDHSEYYVGVASGNVWKTTNDGIIWKPVFDNYGAYSIGVLTMDPNNHNVVWVGTGENNHQRALGYGDGVYKSMDGGKSFKNMGLKNSRQTGGILVDPRNSDVVYVAAEGSAWGPGGDRGLYKTEDGGETWSRILFISENTGVNCIVFDPRNPDVIYASSEQRRRRVYTKIGGGPETAIYKTTDGGNNWKKLTSGLPKEDMGGIGLAVSPVNPDIVFAIIEAANGAGGFFRSTNRGESWQKMSSYHSSGQYYNEIYCDPKDADKVYSVETVSKVTTDGGKTWKSVGNKARHVDDHALWIDPDNTSHFLIGGDGGIYESWDDGDNFDFKENLPVTQFYRVTVDINEPFYFVYGGTQDNNSMGGPSQNTSRLGVTSGEWFLTSGGDGFWGAIDPVNPDIVYAESQYGNVSRFDRKSGESIAIRPEPGKGELTFRWNWNAPLIISPHSHTRLYMAANKVFRSDDRGNSWKEISNDLTAQIDRNTWPVMGKFWSVDAVAKDVSTSLYGTIVSLDESPVKEDLLYAGTDDGLIQVTENGGGSWRKTESFPGVPAHTYVSDVFPSRFDENVVFASFDNTKSDDFKPYLLKSSDRGKTWESIASNLPANGAVHAISQDFIKKDLLFAGTEFGCFFSVDGGKVWTQLKSGIPTIPVMDIAVQERENDLVLATFGRGIYILDDYTPLRSLTPELLQEEGHIFPVSDALMYVQSRGKSNQGSNYFTAENPDFGAVFTYYLKDKPLNTIEQRHKKEKKLFENGERIPQPSLAEQRKEKEEEPPYLLFTVSDEQGNVVRKLTASPSEGISRINWDLRYASTYPVGVKNEGFDPEAEERGGMLAMPGNYKVTMFESVDGKLTELAGPVNFKAKVLNNTTLPAEDRQELVQFQRKVAELIRVVQGTMEYADKLQNKLNTMKQTLLATPEATQGLMERTNAALDELYGIQFELHGYEAKASQEEIPPSPVPVSERLNSIVWAQWRSTSAVTQTQKDAYIILQDTFPSLLQKLRILGEETVKGIQADMEKADAPWTPGQLPEWK